MAGHACNDCGASVIDCGNRLRRDHVECCERCFIDDTHGLLEPVPEVAEQLAARIAQMEARFEARLVLLRTDLMDALRLAAETIATQQAQIDHLVLLRYDNEAVDYDQTFRDHDRLRGRVEIIEACLSEIEQRLKLRRRTSGPSRREAVDALGT